MKHTMTSMRFLDVEGMSLYNVMAICACGIRRSACWSEDSQDHESEWNKACARIEESFQVHAAGGI